MVTLPPEFLPPRLDLVNLQQTRQRDCSCSSGSSNAVQGLTPGPEALHSIGACGVLGVKGLILSARPASRICVGLQHRTPCVDLRMGCQARTYSGKAWLSPDH